MVIMLVYQSRLEVNVLRKNERCHKLPFVILKSARRKRYNIIKIDGVAQMVVVLTIVICSLLQAKHLVITQEKDKEIKMVLSYRLE